ncbi:Phosphoribosylpyrophosphate synthetase [uncultured virus]|nr:Phosphoribosylpyrophosphate synthetase [uncultured virus]
MENTNLITGRSNIKLAEKISTHLGIRLTGCKITDYHNTEISVEILENIRGKSVYILQTGCFNDSHSINDYFMEFELIVNACKLSSAESITALIPYFPYSRADKKDLPRTSLGAALITSKIKNVGVDRIVSMDLHSGQIQGFTDLPFDNLYSIKYLMNFLKLNYFDMKEHSKNDFILVSPDSGGIRRVISYAEVLGMRHIIMYKQRDYTQVSKITKTIIIGDNSDLTGKTAIIIDDIIDTMGTMVAASNELVQHGIKNIIVLATHGIFSGNAIERINSSEIITDVIVTNTLPQEENMKKCPKIKEVDISDLFSEVIKRLELGGSIYELFRFDEI